MYQIADSTVAKVGRIMQSTSFKSEWDKDLNLISMKVRGVETFENGSIDKSSIFYFISVKAKKRHLKLLKKQLGIEDSEVKPESKTKPIIYKLYNDFPFNTGDLEKGAKVFLGRRLSSIYYFDLNDENLALAREHNDVLKEIEKLQTKLIEIKNKMK